MTQSVFRVFSECVQRLFRVFLECVQSVFRVCSGLVVKIVVIASYSASSVSVFGIFYFKVDLKMSKIQF